MIITASFFGVVVLLLSISIAVFHSLKNGRMMLLDWALLAVGGVYGLGWVIVIVATYSGNNEKWKPWLIEFEPLYVYHSAASLILLAAICIGWLLLFKIKISTTLRSSLRPQLLRSRLKRAMWVLLLIAVSLQWLYALKYGGFMGVLDYSGAIRSGIVEVNNNFSFLKPFGGLAIVSTLGFWGLWLSRDRSGSVVLGLAVSLIFSLYILFSWRGRMSFLVFVGSLLLGKLLSRDPRPFKLLAYGTAFMGSILVGAHYVSIWFNLKASSNLFSFIAKELSFPFVSFLAHLDQNEHTFRLFRDFMFSPFYLLPSSWWPSFVEDVSDVNTTLIMGAEKGEGGVTGGVPVDLLTLGVTQAHIAGVLVVGVMFGAFLAFLQRVLDSVVHPGVRSTLTSYFALKVAVLGLFYAQPSLFVSGNVAPGISLVIILGFMLVPKVSFGKKKSRYF